MEDLCYHTADDAVLGVDNLILASINHSLDENRITTIAKFRPLQLIGSLQKIGLRIIWEGYTMEEAEALLTKSAKG